MEVAKDDHGCSLADRICPYRNGLLPPVYANRVFSYPLLASNLHPPPMQCVDYQSSRKPCGDCWKSKSGKFVIH